VNLSEFQQYHVQLTEVEKKLLSVCGGSSTKNSADKNALWSQLVSIQAEAELRMQGLETLTQREQALKLLAGERPEGFSAPQPEAASLEVLMEEAPMVKWKGVDSRSEGVGSRSEGVDSRSEGVGSRSEGVDSRSEGVDSRSEGKTSLE
jgi:hypothetical protein